MITARVGFTFEELPEEHPLHDFDGEFWIKANVDPGCKPTYMQPGDPPEVEIIDARLNTQSSEKTKRLGLDEIHEMERSILGMINTDEKVRDHVYEKLWDRYSESRMLRCED